MGSAEAVRPGADEGDDRFPPARDIELSNADRDDLLSECARLFSEERAAYRVLDRIGFNRAQRPSFTGVTPIDFWSDVFFQLDSGALPPGHPPYWLLISAVLRPYATNRVFRPLAQRYGIIPPDPAGDNTELAGPGNAQASQPPGPAYPPGVTAPGTAPPDACHLIVRLGNEDERQRTQATLSGLGLGPQEVWSTPNAVSYRLNSADASGIRRRLEETSLGWTLVPPGQPDYLIPHIFVSGPDGRRWQIDDAPAQQSVGNVAAEVVEQYPRGFDRSGRPTVVDHVGDDGERRRLGSDETLHEAGIQDGDNLQVGFQATAGAVNPLDRQDALFRVRNELLEYARAHPGFSVSADSALLPMVYEVSFTAASWQPPSIPGGEPEPVHRHRVEIELGPEFPITPPRVTWLSKIFHPNVAPMYDTPDRQGSRLTGGMVCLGLLAESYQPSLSFGELCQILVDLAGYRNYGLVERVTGPDGQVEIRPNVYDAAAKAWVEAHPERILEIGGVDPALVDPGSTRPASQPHRYRNAIRALR